MIVHIGVVRLTVGFLDFVLLLSHVITGTAPRIIRACRISEIALFAGNIAFKDKK